MAEAPTDDTTRKANWLKGRIRIAIAAMVVICVCLAGVSYLFYQQTQSALKEQAERHGAILAASIEKSAGKLLLQENAGLQLQTLAADLSKNPGVAYVQLLNGERQIVAETGKAPEVLLNRQERTVSIGTGTNMTISEAHLLTGEGVLDIVYPVTFSNTPVGTARIGYSMAEINAALSKLRSTSIVVAFLGLLLVAIAVLTLLTKVSTDLYQDSITHKVTGLTVQSYFIDRLEQEIDRSRRYSNRFCVLMTDLDNLKKINDAMGHAQGTFVLKELAALMRKLSRLDTVISIYGGDEFSVILPNAEKEHGAIYMKRILDGIRRHDWTSDRGTCRVSISLGAAMYPDDADTTQGLINCADDALYWAKKHGKNQGIHYSDLPADEGTASGTKPPAIPAQASNASLPPVKKDAVQS